jgi:hypothetical protein
MFISKAEKLAIKENIYDQQEIISNLTIDLYHAKEKIALFEKSDKQIDKLINICKNLNKRIADLEGVKMVDKRKLPKTEEYYKKQSERMKQYWADRKAKEAAQ